MDTTKEYIKMADCPEIQEQKPTEFSWIPNMYFGNHILAHDNNPKQVRNCDNPCEMKDYSIWLPRQDQLQEMVEVEDKAPWRIYNKQIDCLRGFIQTMFDVYYPSLNFEDIEYEQFTTMEQLWLAFVMKEKYNKQWTGEAWN